MLRRLIGEDDDALRKLACKILVSRGYTILEAPNGEAALRVSEEHDGPIHLMLTDVIMPGMSGRDLEEHLHHLRPAMRVVYMSGYTDDTIAHHGVLEKGTEFIQKPFSPQSLARKMREVLDR